VRIFGRLLIALLVIAILPFAALVAHGVDRGRDVASAVHALGRTGSGNFTDPGKLERAPYADAVYVGSLGSWNLDEASGLAPSRRRDDLLWAINDSGNKPKLYAVGLNGSDLGSVRVYGASESVDWEDLASLELDGKPYLLVADIGDNMSWRRQLALYAVEEPELGVDGPPERADVAWSLRFRYADGAHDCEAFGFDATSGQVLLVTKRDVPPVLFGFDLGDPQDQTERVARRLGELGMLPQPTKADYREDRMRGRTRSQVTALSIAPDGAAAVVLTYRDAYQFTRSEGESWADAFARAPQRIPVPPMPQKEALTFTRVGRTLFTTSEQRPAPLFRFDPRDASVEAPRRK